MAKPHKKVKKEKRNARVNSARAPEKRQHQPKAKSKKRTKKRKKPRNLCQLPKNNGYVWSILTALVKDFDLEALPVTPETTRSISTLRGVIRQRSITGYLEWCDSNSLTTLNERSVNAGDLSLREIRWIRLMSLAAKFDFENSPFDTIANARTAFFEYEAVCARTNKSGVFKYFRNETNRKYPNYVLHPVLSFAEQFIHMVLGPKPGLTEFLDASRHGPGATTMKKGDGVLPVYKFHPPIDCTPLAKELLVQSISMDQRWSRSLRMYARRQHRTTAVGRLVRSGFYTPDLARIIIDECPVARVLFVPKNAKTRRTIMAEPTGNIYMQLGVDGIIRRGLKRYGIDLDTQEKNQQLAAWGSTTRGCDTLDLKGASDCIALIWLKFFPVIWAELLEKLRTPAGILPDGELVTLEKLSAMGNGFTFVVESLIFAALTYGVVKVNGLSWRETLPQIAIYGDDIILPHKLSQELAWVLRDVGFMINEDKSFTYGPIRESCGTDYYNGDLISRPTLKSEPHHSWELIRDHNLLYLLSEDYGLKLKTTLKLIRGWIPRRNYGPVDKDRIMAWLFSKTPYTPDGYRVLPSHSCKQALCWQTPVFRVKTLTIGYKDLKPNLRSLDHECFDPLQYLSGPKSNPLWYCTNDGFVIRSTGEKSQKELYFDKAARVVRSTVTYIPEYLWPSKAQSLLEHRCTDKPC